MKSAVSQAQIAIASGLSRTAVSFALNANLRHRLHPDTSRRVLETAARLGYVPHQAAQRLVRAQSRTRAPSFDQIGLIYFEPDDVDLDPAFLLMMGGAEHELSRHHASLTFVRVTQAEDWLKVERMMQSGGVDGWLLSGAVNDAVMDRLRQSSIPSVILGDHHCTYPVHCVTTDSVAFGRLAVHHLASLGHRRIAFIAGTMNYLYQQRTLAGFRSAIQELGLDDDERLIGTRLFAGDRYPATSNRDPIPEWLQKTDPLPTAIFTREFDSAAALHNVLNQLQIKVPGDISIIATERVSLAAKHQKFTRFEWSMAEFGRRGVQLLQTAVMQPRIEPNEIRIPPSLVEGWSTGPAKHPEDPRPSGGTAG